MKALKRQLMAAIAMVLVATIALGSSTYAWFAINTRVTATGMKVTTQVSSNLLIAEENKEAKYATTLTQTREAVLEPTSTVDGVSYFWTAGNNVTGDGSVKAAKYTAYTEGKALDNKTKAGKEKFDADFNTNYGFTGADTSNVAYGYIDYAFYLKATNADTAAAHNVVLDQCAFQYNDAAPGTTDKAWRMAVFVQSATKNTTEDTAVAASNKITLLTLDGADNFTTGEAVNSATETAAVTYGDEAVIGSVAPGGTAYYKVTVRLWLEGEDKTCNNETYAKLNENYTLDLSFRIGTAGATDPDGITEIGTADLT